MNAEFVDTNILVYAHDIGAGGKFHTAFDLLDRVSLERVGVLSTQVLAEFYSTVTRKLRMPAEEAEGILLNLAHWPIHRPDHADLMHASQLHRRYGISWWDSLLVNSAIEFGCTTLWTEDLQNGQQFGSLTVRNPFAVGHPA
jgi:predicted nucleic acid-binding protein